MDVKDGFREWAIVEVMGHTVYAGFCTDASIGGQSYLRVDVPEKGDRKAFTKLLAPGSIFSISPCDEETIRAFVDKREMVPFDRYSLQEVAQKMATRELERRGLPEPAAEPRQPHYQDDDEDFGIDDDDEDIPL